MEQTKQEIFEAGNKEWLIFKCGVQEYGISISSVQELRGFNPDQVTRVAKAPAFVQGLINLRGQIIPVLDLRMILGIEQIETADKTVIVILNIEGRMVGTIVDSVSDVLEIQASVIQPAPKPQDIGYAETLIGLFTHQERLIQILDISRTIDVPAQSFEIAEG